MNGTEHIPIHLIFITLEVEGVKPLSFNRFIACLLDTSSVQGRDVARSETGGIQVEGVWVSCLASCFYHDICHDKILRGK